MKKRMIALMLSLIMVMGCAAAEAENTKHERVYVVTGADGTVRSLTDVIRLENADGLETLRDRSMLTGVENTGGKETFERDGETLVWQAQGREITYQGTSDKAPAVVPVVTLTLDGEAVTAGELKERTGEAELTVTYRTDGTTPMLAATVLPLPDTGISDLRTNNAAVITEMGRRILIGWGAPGMSKELKLPDSFSVSFHADHADLSWMMTAANADALNALFREADRQLQLDIPAEIGEMNRLMTAYLKDGVLPETTGAAKDAVPEINRVNEGLNAVNSGAEALAKGADSLNGGAAELDAGAASLKEGLTALSSQSKALNDGADAMMSAVLAAAGDQLKAALNGTGLTLPELTAENFGEVLTGLSEKLSLAGEEGKAMKEALEGLKAQLTQAQMFVQGVKSYTAGADQAAAGAAQLADGAAGLAAGAAELKDGAEKLWKEGTESLKNGIQGAEKKAAAAVLLLSQTKLNQAVKLYEQTREKVQDTGYDLRAEEMNGSTVYLIRTDLQK